MHSLVTNFVSYAIQLTLSYTVECYNWQRVIGSTMHDLPVVIMHKYRSSEWKICQYRFWSLRYDSTVCQRKVDILKRCSTITPLRRVTVKGVQHT